MRFGQHRSVGHVVGRVRSAIHRALDNHHTYRRIREQGLGGCHFYAGGAARLLDRLGLGTTLIAFGRVSFATPAERWISYPAGKVELKPVPPGQGAIVKSAFHAWTVCKTPGGERHDVDLDLSNLLRIARSLAGSEGLRFDLERQPEYFCGTRAQAWSVGIRFEPTRYFAWDHLAPDDRMVFDGIAAEAASLLRPAPAGILKIL